MKTWFDEFAQFAKEEFGLTVVKEVDGKKASFESLFGASIDSLTQYELPYNTSADQFGYYDEGFSLLKVKSLPKASFDANDSLLFAA